MTIVPIAADPRWGRCPIFRTLIYRILASYFLLVIHASLMFPYLIVTGLVEIAMFDIAI